ncbi:protein of unknown function (plasmid) [Cupriavidus taiwanensis]|uniref:Uncharacterized protein n=1 Tax=Cupriavidus taiwanensis TaxID=164546 RepID=A0A7Z7NPS9_9BURK|nr:hypothetical protein CBM2597_P20014 [Cupriavidus taiwanensis]SOZ95295.1 hypothetical protein CBM2598_P20014 [Cupriavidus taiwanensis]SPC25212.1 hypothetical protein CBM2594_P20014 [Cupriavidus taiwanensis]SPD37125.1 protein of unknown function [Cupriavidus taiwanensis]SPD37787.1 protein of unknown function [Cupriavidus taiwanensis]
MFTPEFVNNLLHPGRLRHTAVTNGLHVFFSVHFYGFQMNMLPPRKSFIYKALRLSILAKTLT